MNETSKLFVIILHRNLNIINLFSYEKKKLWFFVRIRCIATEGFLIRISLSLSRSLARDIFIQQYQKEQSRL